MSTENKLLRNTAGVSEQDKSVNGVRVIDNKCFTVYVPLNTALIHAHNGTERTEIRFSMHDNALFHNE